MKKQSISLLREWVSQVLQEVAINNFELPNTFFSDMNEILLASAVLGGTSIEDVRKFVGDAAHKQVKDRVDAIYRAAKKLGESEAAAKARVDVEFANGKAMASETLKWARDNDFGEPEKVFWTARPGELKKALLAAGLKDEPTPGHPADIAILFDSGKVLGVSAKATKGAADVGFKNMGWGTLAKYLSLDPDMSNKLIDKEIKKIDASLLKLTKDEQKLHFRSSSELKNEADLAGRKVLQALRDEVQSALSELTEKELREFIIREMLDASEVTIPVYVKVTATQGGKGAHVLDPSSNEVLDSVMSKNLKSLPARNDSIVFTSDASQKICQLRLKFASQMLASSVKLSAEP